MTIFRSAGEPFRAKYRRPFIEWQIAGDHRGAAFIALISKVSDRCLVSQLRDLFAPRGV